MLNACSSDQRVLGYLGRALSLELSAVQLYTTQACLASLWGLKPAAQRLRQEASEEMQHAERIIERMLALGVAPAASQLLPVRLGQSLPELLFQAQAFEQEIVQLYADARQHCARIGAHDDRLFFAALLQEEQQHQQGLLDWLHEVEGVQPQTARGWQT
ncbi:MAG: bacterioferritin [Gammaproteobacteria bacterium SHHR-1]|uniref:ferritin-like domain-containing protein n=1 Tax=Magnetovirga frankeli TaxID=947516 RepID=UPI0012931BB0|nr:bacterioferritin [gamma proteobacterium SS-5]